MDIMDKARSKLSIVSIMSMRSIFPHSQKQKNRRHFDLPPVWSFLNSYRMSSNSTSNTKVAFGGITSPAPRSP